METALIDVGVSVVFCDAERYKQILLKHDPDRISSAAITRWAIRRKNWSSWSA